MRVRTSSRSSSAYVALGAAAVLSACATPAPEAMPAGAGSIPEAPRSTPAPETNTALMRMGLAYGNAEGFAQASAAEQARCEALFLDLPSSETFRERLREITREPHPTGSERQIEVGRYLADEMRRDGLAVEMHPYDVYLPQLTDDVEAHIVTPVAMRLSNREPAFGDDPFSDNPALLNGWNAFSGSGDVIGEVVYANYGRREDYEALDSMGIDLTGKIVIARYGGNFRGFKVKFAEARGAAGVIMFVDRPANASDPYPDGPMSNSETIQRGSVLTLDWTGDPLTPFEPALPMDDPDTPERLNPDEVGLHTIPVLPLGWGAASEILSRMTGEVAPAGWQGGLDLDYRLLGGEDLTVRVRVNQPKALTRATNVVGTLRGSEFPDEWIILGAHYDPWGYGAIDPNGGTAMLMALSQALGRLADAGCAPRRSIMIAHWDAEEYGIIGSTEWVEEFREELEANAVAYLNADAAISGGNFGGSSSPSLKGVILGALDDVAYPGEVAGVASPTVLDHWRASASDGDPSLGNLGGGSDHVAFYTHAGVPSAGLSSGGRNGVYHSNYDNFHWFSNFGDTDFVFGPMIARVDGLVALRLANSDILPYNPVRYAVDAREHVRTLYEVAESRGVAVDLSGLDASIEELSLAAFRFEGARTRALSGDVPSSRVTERVNRALIGLEKAWLDDGGLQWGAWARSLYVSPDPFSGYASWMLPGLRYEIETDDPAGIDEWIPRYEAAIDRLTVRLRDVTGMLTGG